MSTRTSVPNYMVKIVHTSRILLYKTILTTNQLVVRCAPAERQMPWFACRKLDSDFGMILGTSASRILASYMRVSGI